MASSSDGITTDVYHDGTEVAVRARSQHSRDAHVPLTDGDGVVAFFDGDGNRVDADHADAHPEPDCRQDLNTDTEWVLRPVEAVAFRGECRKCHTPDDVAEQNQQNGGSKTPARRLRWGESWGENQSDTASHTSGD